MSTLVEAPWSFARRGAFRALFAYCVVYGLYAVVNGAYDVPVPLADAVIPWVAKHVLRLRADVSIEVTGSGDRTYDYVWVFCAVIVTAAATLVWSIADRRRAHHADAREGLRVLVRYELAAIMLLYGLVKVWKGQFPFPGPDRLIERYGESSPMGLAWTFIGYSGPYQVIGGLAETVGALLLYLRRTTVLGALVIASVMTNVVMINFCYDVPVKLFSSHLLLASIYLIAPDVPRLVNVLVLQRPALPADDRPHFSRGWLRPGALVAKTLVIGVSVWSAAAFTVKASHAANARPTLYGVYEVESFVRRGQEVPPLLTDPGRWRRLTVNRRSRLTIHAIDDSREVYALKDDAANGTLLLTSTKDKETSVRLSYARPDADHLTIEGTWDARPIAVRLRRVDESTFLLVDRGFHWVNDYAFNR